jgi:hypothetical protein
MRYRVDLPIINKGKAVFEVEADNKDEPIETAKQVWPDFGDHIVRGQIKKVIVRTIGRYRLAAQPAVHASAGNPAHQQAQDHVRARAMRTEGVGQS